MTDSEVVQQRLLTHYSQIITETTAAIVDANEWNRLHANEKPIDPSTAVTLRGLARRARGYVERWEAVPEELLEQLEEADG
jgi:hypothetical protein